MAAQREKVREERRVRKDRDPGERLRLLLARYLLQRVVVRRSNAFKAAPAVLSKQTRRYHRQNKY